MTTNDFEKAEELSTYFSSAFTIHNVPEITQIKLQKLLTKLKPDNLQGQITIIPEFRGA